MTIDDINKAHGMTIRREVLGDTYVDRAVATADARALRFQQFVTEYCWGTVWGDERLSRRERSLLVLGMTAGLGRFTEFEAHVRGAVRNGITHEELESILVQLTVYCGVPTGVSANKAMASALAPESEQADLDQAPDPLTINPEGVS